MTAHHTAQPPLRTDDDVFDRVSALVGRATADRQLWMMFVDGDDRQSPVVMPVSDMPSEPEPGTAAKLAQVLGGVREELTTDRGPGSVILTWERLGPDRPVPADQAWADVLDEACRLGDVVLRGMFLSTPGGTQRLRS